MFSHTGKSGMTCAIEQHPWTKPEHARDAETGPQTESPCGARQCQPSGEDLSSERQRDACCIAQANRLPCLPNFVSDGYFDRNLKDK